MCDNTDNGISTQIVLVCDPLETWTQRDLSHIVHVEQQPDCVVSNVCVCVCVHVQEHIRASNC